MLNEEVKIPGLWFIEGSLIGSEPLFSGSLNLASGNVFLLKSNSVVQILSPWRPCCSG